MNITLSIDEKLAERARKVAEGMEMSLNQLIRSYLEDLTSTSSAEDDVRRLRELSAQGKGRSRGWRFDRDEIHDRAKLR